MASIDEDSEGDSVVNSVNRKGSGKIGTSRFHWFARGLVGGLLLAAAANALSFFFRSGFGTLFGDSKLNYDAIGFPFEVWNSTKNYGTWIYDLKIAIWNVGFGILVGTFFGIIGIICKPKFDVWVSEFEAREKQDKSLKMQFSIKTLLVLTTLIAFLFAAVTAWGSSPHLLGAIYFLGPLSLVLIAMSPDSIRWQHRIVVLVFVAIGMLVLAFITGSKLGLSEDQVMLGIFVCWTPQSAIAAFFITVGLIIQLWRKPQTQNDSAEQLQQTV